jgi:hypothetical protein
VHDLVDREDLFDAAGGLTSRQQTFVLPAGLGGRDNLAAQRSRSRRASSRSAAPFRQEPVWQRPQHGDKPAVPGSGVMSLSTSAFMVVLRLSVDDRLLPFLQAPGFFDAMSELPRLTPAAPSTSAAAMPRRQRCRPRRRPDWRHRSPLAAPEFIVLTSPQ